jgi:hypothetical protein
MRTDEKIASDLQALARATTRGLPSPDDTARALTEAQAQRKGASIMSKLKRPLMASALTVAAAIAILVFPVPYSRQRGFDVTFTRSDGRVAHLHIPGSDRARAEARARELAHGADVTLEPRRERVWGSVYAMAQEKLLHIDVDMQGKSEKQIEDEINAQLVQQGWAVDTVVVHRGDEGKTRMSITAHSGDEQRRIEVVSEGAGEPGAEHVRVEGLEVQREPGMSDAELRDKILREMKARGLEGEVSVDNGKVRVRAEKRVEQ